MATFANTAVCCEERAKNMHFGRTLKQGTRKLSSQSGFAASFRSLTHQDKIPSASSLGVIRPIDLEEASRNMPQKGV